MGEVNPTSSNATIASNDGLVDNWQASREKVSERFGYLFNNEKLADIHFIVGKCTKQQRIPAHKLVLSAGSVVFEAMFSGPLATTSDEMELPDVEPLAFLTFLKFIYSDVVQICQETVMSTLYIAKKYYVSALERHCVDFLKSNLNANNAFLLLTQARLFDEPQLAELCLDTIDKNTKDAIAADGFTDIDLDTLIVVLERNTLLIEEFKLFEAIERWTKAECARKKLPLTSESMRSVLGRAFGLIRFLLMSIEEFAFGPAKSDLLNDREVREMFLYLTKVNPKPTDGILDVPRCAMTGKEKSVNRFPQVVGNWSFATPINRYDCIQFSVDKRIFVVGFGLYGSINGPAIHEVHLNLKRSVTGVVRGSEKTSLSSNGSSSPYRVMFQSPIEILPNTLYTASVISKGPATYSGINGKSTITIDGSTFQFSNKLEIHSNNLTSTESGQIPEIIFYS
ncbi:BTB/POZ domain-containing protein 2-like [Chrysoperla carnea]|uniref:BTB/POZ domain-containing protein 2-like n=1 Tax=Chrysoperla carnea TaxID=189513 RepID=UPI001D07B155|nr:BTB/POZ domain-containing protein 2-like [Chrysoperla carnea]